MQVLLLFIYYEAANLNIVCVFGDMYHSTRAMILQLDLSYILSYVAGVQSVYLKRDNMADPVGELMHIFTARSSICKVKEEKGG
jgi:hypothetical protein